MNAAVSALDAPAAPTDPRAAAVAGSGVMDSPRTPAFDALCATVAAALGAEVALVSLLDDRRQWFKAAHGTDLVETPVGWSFCRHALATPQQLLAVEDALADPRVCDSPLVTGPPGIRAYLGAPLTSRQGVVFGTLCVIDTHPRPFTPAQRDLMRAFGRLAAALLDEAIDTADRERADRERSLTQQSAMALMLTHGLDPKAYIGPDRCYGYANLAFLDYLGLPLEGLVGRAADAALPGHDLPRLVGERLGDALGGQPVHLRQRLRGADGESRWTEVSLLPAAPAGGVVLRLRDVHELVHAHDALVERNLQQQQFIQVLAHDVREPLRTINAFLDLALQNPDLPPAEAELVQFLQRAQRGGRRLSHLVGGLLDYLKADGRSVDLAPLCLAGLLEEVREDLEALVRGTGGAIDGELPVAVLGHGVWLRVCLQNLIVNALKYSRPGVPPRVRVSARTDGAAVVVDIEDNGCGVPAAQAEAIFQPFVRLPGHQPIDGAGLGLSLCRRIARLHGGTLELAHSGPQGSLFRLRLTRAEGGLPPHSSSAHHGR